MSQLEELFAVKDVNPEWQATSGGKSKPFTRVSRLHCTGENYEMELILDIHNEIYPIESGDRFSFVLAHTLNEDGSMDGGETEFDQSKKPSLQDKFEYVMHGKVYKCEEDEQSNRLSIYMSFGGLLMRLKGDASNLLGIELDQHLYLLIRKV